MSYEEAVKKLLEEAKLPETQQWISLEVLKAIAGKLDDDKD